MANDGRNVSLTARHRRFIDIQVETGWHASSSEVVREALRRYESDVEAEKATIDALWMLADKSEAREVAGDFTDIQDEEHLDQFMAQMLDDVLNRRRAQRIG